MVEPNLEDLIANCPSGSQYEIFLKHRDLFDFPLESLEPDGDQDVPVMNAAELQHFEPFRTADMRGLSLGNIGIPSPSIGTTLIVPKEEPLHDFADTSRGNFYFQVDHAASLGGGPNQALSPDSVFNSNRSSSGEREISRSSHELIEVAADTTQSQSSANISPARRSRRIASREMSRSKGPLQKKTKLMSQLLDGTEGSERAEMEKCSDCGVTQTTEWSEGPNGPNTLCKACGIRYRHGLFLGENSAVTPTSYQDQTVKDEPVSWLEPEMSQSSVCFEFHPHADKAYPNKLSLNKKMKQPKMTPITSGRHFARKCSHCEVVKTTQWREGPMGPRTLCNPCGLRYRSGRLFPEYRPANSPTFVPSIHSCSHRKVVELRRSVTKEASLSEKEPTQPLSDAVNEATTELPLASYKANEEATVAGTEPPMLPPLKDMNEVAMIDIESPISPCGAREQAAVSGRELTTSQAQTIQETAIVVANPSVSPPEAIKQIVMNGREPPISQAMVVQEAKTSMLLDFPFKDPKGSAIAEPLISPSKAVEEVVMSNIRASMSQYGGSVSEVIEVAYRVEMILGKVRKLKNKLSNLSGTVGMRNIRSQGSNIVEGELSMPWDSPYEGTKECVIGLLAAPLNSPPKDVGKTVMADMEAPMSQCGGSVYEFTEGAFRAKRVLKKKKNSKKKLPKLSSKGGVKKTLSQASTGSGKCLHCEVTQTPQWRDGPLGPKTLCNACGIRYKAGGLLPEYRPAASPAFVPSLHSNSQKSVVQMRKKDTHEEAVVGIVTANVHQEAAIVKMEPGTPPPPEFTPSNSYSVNSESGDICCFP